MNNSEQAKKGFQTFVLTLSVSLILFSVIYYLVTSVSTRDKPARISEDYKTDVMVDPEPSVAGVNDSVVEATEPEEEDVSGASVFGKLAGVVTPPPSADVPAVLAGATEDTTTTTTPSETTTVIPETTETTSVPDTGFVEVTSGLATSLIVFVLGIWSIMRNPKENIKDRFEKSFF